MVRWLPHDVPVGAGRSLCRALGAVWRRRAADRLTVAVALSGHGTIICGDDPAAEADFEILLKSILEKDTRRTLG